MIYGLIGGWVVLAIIIIVQENKIHKLATKFDNLVGKHNSFVDCVRDEFDNIYDETNDRIDEINNEFDKVYSVLKASQEFSNELTDTMELMCDTDEVIIDRLNELEDDVDMMWDAVEEHDEILYEFFDGCPEQAEEEKPAKKSKKK